MTIDQVTVLNTDGTLLSAGDDLAEQAPGKMLVLEKTVSKDIADNIRWSDLSGTESVAPVIAGRDFVIATLAPPTKSNEPAAAEGAAAAPAKGGKAPAKPAAKK